MFPRVLKTIEEIKCVEQNRKFFLTLVCLLNVSAFLLTGKISEIVFKDMFLIILVTYTSANVISKYLLGKPK